MRELRGLQESSHEELFHEDVLTDDESDWREEQKEELQGNELGAVRMNCGDGCISQNQSTVDSRKMQLPFSFLQSCRQSTFWPRIP